LRQLWRHVAFKWIRVLKSKGETAEILSVSLSCVKRRCENIFFKLGTNNLSSSVAKALNMGIINPF
jgi:DNA-binding CsgD family transcriptional regulator